MYSNKRATSLSIKNNYKLKVITNSPVLTVLRLNNTCVQKIVNCPALYQVEIANNADLQVLKSHSVVVARISNCEKLRRVRLLRATTLHLDTPAIHTIYAPCVKDVTFEYIDARSILSKLNQSFYSVQSLTLDSVHCCLNLNQAMVGSSVKWLVRRCDCETIDSMPCLEELLIDECSALKVVTNLDVVKGMTIDNCSLLRELPGTTCAGKVAVSRCNCLTTIESVIAAQRVTKFT